MLMIFRYRVYVGLNMICATFNRAKVSTVSNVQPFVIPDFKPGLLSKFLASTFDMRTIFQCFCNSKAISGSVI